MRRRCRAGCSSVASRRLSCRNVTSLAVMIVCGGVGALKVSRPDGHSPHITPFTHSLPLDGRSRRETGRHLEHADRRQVAAVAVLLCLLRRRRRAIDASSPCEPRTPPARHDASAAASPTRAPRASREREVARGTSGTGGRPPPPPSRSRRRCVAARELERLHERLEADGHFSASGAGEAAAAVAPGRYSSLHFVAAAPRARSGSGRSRARRAPRACARRTAAPARAAARRARARADAHRREEHESAGGVVGLHDPLERAAGEVGARLRVRSTERLERAKRRGGDARSEEGRDPRLRRALGAEGIRERRRQPPVGALRVVVVVIVAPRRLLRRTRRGAAATARASDDAAAASRTHVDGSKAWWAAARSDAASISHSPSAHS